MCAAGGPGGSGVSLIWKAGPAFQTILGPLYSVIGFDPRGIMYTTPSVDCFPSNPIARIRFMESLQKTALNNSIPGNVAQAYAEAYGLGKQCEGVVGQGDDAPGKHVSTPVVARDMLSIVEAEMIEAGLRPEDGKLWYWGFSYGSVLGTVRFRYSFGSPNRN